MSLFVGWSDCSATCGPNGIQKVNFECVPPPGELFYDCGLEPISVRKCNTLECPQIQECTDDSVLCQEDTLMRYCVIPEYKEKCCASCLTYNET